MASTSVSYNNAMPLGQGFNTYTQQIYIDDAVIIDRERTENVPTNDGSTMRILVQSVGRPSPWYRQPEIVLGGPGHRINAADDQGQAKVYIRTIGPRETTAAMRGTSSDIPKQEMAPEDRPSYIVAGGSQVDSPEGQYHQLEGGGKEATLKGRQDSFTDPVHGSVDQTTNTISHNDLDAKIEEERRVTANGIEHERTKRELRRIRDHERLEVERERTEEQLRMVREQARLEVEREQQKEREQLEKELRKDEESRREDLRQARDTAAGLISFTDDELKAPRLNLGVEGRFKAISEEQQEFDFTNGKFEGPSQTVTYTSKLIEKLSDISDINTSALSVKGGTFGGPGHGIFVDPDSFKESDLNFHISVKVVNQTINFKDPLQFNPARSCFISGFQEGGEFNALVSMKILNTAKKLDIKADAETAFTAGPLDLTAEVNFNTAKQNIETNAETTIHVSWSGGGQITPREEPWNIKNLMQAVSRFPDLVALRPKRTYAIITKYDALRSFGKLKLAGFTALQHENAQIYTNTLMDAYMSYKRLHTKITADISDVQNNNKVILTREEPQESNGAMADVVVRASGEASPRRDDAETIPFETTLKGLEDAGRDVRRQLALIVNEINRIADEPSLSTDSNRAEPFHSPSAFEQRLPIIEPMEHRALREPLGENHVIAKTQRMPEYEKAAKEEAEAVGMPDQGPEKIKECLPNEKEKLDVLADPMPTRGDANEADLDVTESFTKLSISNTHQEALERQALTWVSRPLSWKGSRVQIYCIIWGGQLIENEAIGMKIRELGDMRQKFSFSNELFGADTLPNVVKTGQIIYSSEESGDMRCLTRQEGQEATFD